MHVTKKRNVFRAQKPVLLLLLQVIYDDAIQEKRVQLVKRSAKYFFGLQLIAK